MSDVAAGLERIRARVRAACERVGRPEGDVELVAVSKTHPASAVREAWGEGQRDFGESRVQEALAKVEELPAGIRWHFIGRLQTNKVRRALGAFEIFHSLDRIELAEAMNRIAGELGVFPRVLIEVNVAGEGTKAGFNPDDLRRHLDALLGLDRLQVEGLMTLAPYAEDPEASRPVFRRLRELRDALAVETGLPFGTLSMGMSGDFEVAIEEGSTLVRVGTAIFGRRPATNAEAGTTNGTN